MDEPHRNSVDCNLVEGVLELPDQVRLHTLHTCIMKTTVVLVASICAPLVLASNMRQPIYKDADAPIEDRVADLLSKMTLQEKVNQVRHIVSCWWRV